MLIIRSLFKPFICFETPDAAGGGASGTGDPAPEGSGAPGTVTQPDLVAAQALVTEWQNRAVGWQQKHQLEFDAHKNTATTLKELQEATGKTAAEQAKIIAERDALKKKEADLSASLGSTNAQLERLTMITTEFPELVPFIKDGLIPDGTGEDLKVKLTAFSSKIKTLTNLSAEQIAKQIADGATPPPPPDSSKKESLQGQAMTALKAGNIAEYNRLMDEHYKQQKQ